jgi:hypothetical protein
MNDTLSHQGANWAYTGMTLVYLPAGWIADCFGVRFSMLAV